jgi:hypothetical protein
LSTAVWGPYRFDRFSIWISIPQAFVMVSY